MKKANPLDSAPALDSTPPLDSALAHANPAYNVAHSQARIAKSKHFIDGKARNIEPTTLETPIQSIAKNMTKFDSAPKSQKTQNPKAQNLSLQNPFWQDQILHTPAAHAPATSAPKPAQNSPLQNPQSPQTPPLLQIPPESISLESAPKSKARVFYEILGMRHRDIIIPSVKTDLRAFVPERDSFVWFGHSSLLFCIGGKTIAIDPVLDGSAAPLPFIIKPFKGADIYSSRNLPDIDYLIITHNHYDHLSKKSIKLLARRVGLAIVPLGVGKYLQKWGIEPSRIFELDWGEDMALNEALRVYCLPARHFSGRKMVDMNASLWASFVLECGGEESESVESAKVDSMGLDSGGVDSDSFKTPHKTHIKRIFLSGDGGYGSHFAEIGARFGRIDMAFLENGQYNKDWAQVHSFPNECLQAAKDLHARAMMPIHNCKFQLSFHKWYEPLECIARLYERYRDELSFALVTPMIGEIAPLWQDFGVQNFGAPDCDMLDCDVLDSARANSAIQTNNLRTSTTQTNAWRRTQKTKQDSRQDTNPESTPKSTN
ncbi:hypothetical protein BKN38_04590 [Helicobacter sp. CLO-3]|uniref:MBL fold metallo-hydrolase n=1 Tax=unclassified Helicobacter TaxID=2593540 RepID=UPI000805547F|nr:MULTISPECIES: MBL fold metallo-hydrolase [unclassified Helicobacter]OBV29819.1 hypothetical protein BA723_04085 [Helicobacter sp. CLO-3]OHU83969.1 hypothetical protein BKN38_04590 [Helicobacter sp. CLO-3]